jgi:hypothetical protein
MLAYIALVAVLNVLLGAFVAQVVDLSPFFCFIRRTPPMTHIDDSLNVGRQDDIPISSPETSASVEGFTGQSKELVQTETEDVPLLKKTPPANAKTWGDFAQQLRDVKSRTRYCRPAQNMKLARQAAEQLKACAIVWYSQFEKCLLGEELDEETRMLVSGADMGAVEMFAAQIETTITNLGALDFTGSVDELLNLIEKELELLDNQQKKVASNREQLVLA